MISFSVGVLLFTVIFFPRSFFSTVSPFFHHFSLLGCILFAGGRGVGERGLVGIPWMCIYVLCVESDASFPCLVLNLLFDYL